MQSAGSLSSLSSNASSHSSSTYGSRTVLDAKDLPSASARCRSSIVSYHDIDDVILSPPPRPPRRRSYHPASTLTRPTPKCKHLLRHCLGSTGKTASMRHRFFAELCQQHRLLLVLNDYDCQCGCHFSMRRGSFVVQYESRNGSSPLVKRGHGTVTVISEELVCSKIPSECVCDVKLLRERVRVRQLCDEDQTFDL
jgi:hypothetical protein